jgi:hypothetical protein
MFGFRDPILNAVLEYILTKMPAFVIWKISGSVELSVPQFLILSL